jgi:RNA polymerase sigma-70 factor (ECF subfamily)
MERDPRQFERTFREHHDAVLAYALRRAGCDADARDVVAETFLVAWRRFDEAPSDSRLPWLYGVARRLLANQRRAATRRSALVDRLGSAASPAAAADGDGALLDALARLAAGDREVLLLVAWEGLSAEEAGHVLGCRGATVRMRLHRARGRLAALLDEPGTVLAPAASMEPAS